MKSVKLNGYGGVNNLEIMENLPLPALKSGQLLLEVWAAGLNPFDAKLITGAYKDMIPLALPITLGGDVAGAVIEVAKDVTEFKVRDKVFGTAIVLNGGSGAYAQVAAINTTNAALMPKTASFAEAAGLPSGRSQCTTGIG